VPCLVVRVSWSSKYPEEGTADAWGRSV
jgi:hypothetical protein